MCTWEICVCKFNYEVYDDDEDADDDDDDESLLMTYVCKWYAFKCQ